MRQKSVTLGWNRTMLSGGAMTASRPQSMSPQRNWPKPVSPEILQAARQQDRLRIYFAGALRKIMSYNAQNFYRNREGRIVKPEESIRALGEVILKEKPDVLALQEVGDPALLAWFNERYLKGGYPNIVTFPVGTGRGIQVAMMSKRPIRALDVKSHWHEQNHATQDATRRDFLEATFETGSGCLFTVYTGHFKSMVGGERETLPKRQAEAESAARIVGERLQQDAQAAIFVMGDFNALPDSPYGVPVLNTLALRRNQSPDNDLTEVLMQDRLPQPTRVATRRHPASKLDYIFASPCMLKRVTQAYVAGHFKQDPWRLASDHLPVVAMFEEPDILPARRTVPKPAIASIPDANHKDYRLDLIA